MPVDVHWLDDSYSTFYYRFEDPWTVNELVAALDHGYKMSEFEPATYLVYDLSAGKLVPRNFLSARQIMRARIQTKVKVRVFVGFPQLGEVFFHMLVSALPSSVTDTFVLMPTLEAALEYLDAQKSTQP